MPSYADISSPDDVEGKAEPQPPLVVQPSGRPARLDRLTPQLPEGPAKIEIGNNPRSQLCTRVLKAAGALGVLAGGIVGRVYSGSDLCSIFIGVGAQSAANSIFKDDCSDRVEQVALMAFSQVSTFFISYFWSNCNLFHWSHCSSVEASAIAMIAVKLGGALAVYGNYYRKKWFNPIDSVSSPMRNVCHFSSTFPTFLPKEVKVLYPIASAACLGLWFYFTDAVAKGICSFGAAFYGGQIVSQLCSTFIDQKIAKASREAIKSTMDSYEKIPRSKLRVVKGVLNGLAPLAIALAWIPWSKNPQSLTRIHQLWVVGLITGLFDGFLWKSQENRFQHKPIDEQDELKKRTPESRCIRVWRIASMAIVQIGIAAIFVKELVFSSNPFKDQVAIGSMYAGFAISTIKNLAIDAFWNVEKRLKVQNPTCWDKIKDRLVIQQMLPRFLGLAPAYVYFVLTNSVAMHSGETENTFHQWLNWVAWFFYGQGMENEFHQAWGEQKGLLHYPLMGSMSDFNALKMQGAFG